MIVKTNSLIKLIDIFAKFASKEEELKTTIVNAIAQGLIPNFIKELKKDNVAASVKIGHMSGVKSIFYSEVAVSLLQFEEGLDKEEKEYLVNKYKKVPSDLKSYLTKYEMVPEGGPFVITFP